jgi:lysophospholipase L1-like esterase
MSKRTHRALVLVAFPALIASWVFADDPRWFVLNLILAYLWLWAALYAFSAVGRREHAGRFLLATTTLVLVIGLLELPALLGLLDYRVLFGVRIAAPWQNPEYETDAELVHRRPAHYTASGETYGDIAHLLDVPDARRYTFDVRLDRNGFRNATDLDRADIVLLGDSFIEAGLVPDSDHVGTRLAAETQQVVANLGNVAYGPRHQLVLLRRFALPLQPRTVIWLFFEGNDLQNIATYDSLVNVAGREAGAAPWRDRSFSRNTLVQFMRIAGNPRPSAVRRSGVVRLPDGTSERAYFLYGLTPVDEERRQRLDQLAGILREAHALIATAGSRLLVAFVPVKYRVYEDALSEKGPIMEQWPGNDMPARVEQIVRSISPDIGFLDLTHPLRDALRAGALPYFADDSHWNSDGHRATAQALARALTTPAR